MKTERPITPKLRLWIWLAFLFAMMSLNAGKADDDLKLTVAPASTIGSEVAIPKHLHDGEVFTTPLPNLLSYGSALFKANWTIQEGQGRPLLKGTGRGLADPSSPLVFPRNMNRFSGPDANSCAGCHNSPAPGGAGDIVSNVFVLGQRFDSVTFDPTDLIPTRGSLDERGRTTTASTFANSRATPGMFGAGYYEMLAREMTADLQAIASTLQPGRAVPLLTKGAVRGIR